MKFKVENIQSIGPSYLCRKNMALKYIKEIKPLSILEVGCGSGDLALNLSMNYDYTGIDLNKNNIQKLKQEINFSNFFCVDLLNFNSDKKFDIVICFEVIEHVKDDLNFLNKLAGFIKPGGYLLLSTPGRKEMWGSNDTLAGHYRRYSIKELEELLNKSGMSGIEIRSIGIPIANLLKYYNDYRADKILSNYKDFNNRNFTIESGIKSKGLLNLFFNDYTLYPFYLIQRIFSKSDKGINYFVKAQYRGW